MASSSRLDLFANMPPPKRIKTASTSLPSSSSSSSSSASPPNLKWTYDYDVFLSFRGEDTRNNFADHLYMNLTQKGINTFRDDEGLQRGKEISGDLVKAIEESRFAIIIFSENYASSSWCLDELVKIIDCTKEKETGQIAYPVFYNVDPSNVRNQKGSFAEAFDEHKKKNLALEKMEKWKEALRCAGRLSGWDTRGRPEAEIIQKIVDEIFYKLNRGLLRVDDNLVGMEIRMKEINTLLDIRSNNVKFVGIHGVGGMGKTTIAKVLYNRIYNQFEGCSYLANVREKFEKEGNLVSLQKQLLYEILKVDLKIFNDDRGSSVIQDRLNNKKVLIILDDVDHIDQLDKLVGKGEWFGQGSVIIITTRDQRSLSKNEGVQRYEVRECDSDKSLEIFSWKAFKQNHPPEDYMELSNEVVRYTKGLPLALTVLGSHLRDRSKNAWRDAIDKLSIAPNKEINDILKISYEGLDQTQKDVFLDIACFFTGEDKDEVMKKLHGFDFFPYFNIPVLIDKSLITVSAKNELMMHDLVRDMGRHIVHQESPKNPEKRSRLWNTEDIRRVLEKNMATEAIECIRPKLMRYWSLIEGMRDWSFKAEAFMEMKNLRFLELVGYPYEHLALDFPYDKLVHLSLKDSSIKLLWNGRKDLPHLKSIDLSRSKHLRKFPDVSGLPNLEQLSLWECEELVEIHPSVWVHKRLKFLDLTDCYKISFGSFPNKIEMESLETLHLGLCYQTDYFDCSNMEEFPEVHGNMKRLSELVLSATAIKGLPSSIENFTALKILNLYLCMNLVCLPSSICKLKYLEQLILGECSSLDKLPEDLGELESLVKLDASSTAIKEVPASIQFLVKLKNLSFTFCSGIKLPSFFGLSSLTELDLSCCDLTDETFPSNIECLSSLEILDLRRNNFVSLPANITQLSLLTKLLLTNCRNLEKLPENLRDLESLVELDASITPIKEVPDSIQFLDKLRNLSFRYCSGLNLPSFNGLSSLTELDLSHCSGLNLPSFNGLSLTKLNLSNCSGLKLPSFNGLSSLTELDLSKCDLRDETFPSNIECLSSLETLVLSGNNFVSLPANITQLSLLTKLDLSSCRNLEKLPESLGGLESLVDLDASETAIKEVPASIQFLDKLRYLSFCYCSGLNLPSFNGLLSLTLLYLSHCSGLNLPSFNGLPSSLTVLSLSWCDLTDETFPSNIECLSSLKTLYLSGNNFVSLPANITQLSLLTELDLQGCRNLEKLLENLGDLESLEELVASETAIKEVPASIQFLDKLRKLSFVECSGLKLPSFYGLSSLTELDLSKCDLRDETFPINIECLSSLETLNLSGNNFVSLPANITQLSLLRFLDLSDCKRIESIPELPSSILIYTYGCTSLTLMNDFSDVNDEYDSSDEDDEYDSSDEDDE